MNTTAVAGYVKLSTHVTWIAGSTVVRRRRCQPVDRHINTRLSKMPLEAFIYHPHALHIPPFCLSRIHWCFNSSGLGEGSTMHFAGMS